MPKEYRGRLSKACETCRTRKIKCSEDKPVCARCTTYKLSCQYRNLDNLWVRDETKATARRAHLSLGVNSAVTKLASESQHQSIASTLSLEIIENSMSVLRPAPCIDISDLARARFLFDYTLPSRGEEGNDGMLDFLPAILMRTRQGSALDEAVHAVSLANFCRRTPGCGTALMRSRAYNHCQRAMGQVKQMVGQAEAEVSNELLLTVFLLGIFETMSTGGGSFEFWDAHARGLAALLASRLPKLIAGYSTSVDRQIFCGLSFQMLFTCLRLKRVSYLSYSLVRPLYDNDPSSTLRLLRYVHEAVDLLGTWEQIKGDGLLLQVDIPTILEGLDNLDHALAQWTESLVLIDDTLSTSSAVQNQPMWLRSLFDHPGAPCLIDSYRDIQRVIHLNLVRVIVLSVNQAHLQASAICTLPNEDYSSTSQRRQTVGFLAEGLCRSVFALLTVPILGKPILTDVHDIVALRVYYLVNPLHTALACAKKGVFGIDSQSRADWIAMLLSFIDRNIHNKGQST